MRDLVERIITALVEHPDKVRVNEVKGQATTIIEVDVDPSDRRFVIGKQGRNIEAIQHLVSCVAVARKLIRVRVFLIGAERQQ
ncbi:MAG: KH domain-containing protein [bacterium]